MRQAKVLYNLTWNNAPTGLQQMRVVATDNNGIKTYSESINIYVTNPPTVSIVSPTTGISAPKPAIFNFAANAKDFDGYISKVEFFTNGEIGLGRATLSQANYYTLTSPNVPTGTHTITAVATDNLGATKTSSPITVTVTNQPPTVALSNPTNGATFTAPANILLRAVAADADGWINKFEYFRGTTKLGESYESDFIFNWNNVTAGTYSLKAKATDEDGAVTTSSPITITVNSIGNVLLVVGSTSLNTVDTAIRNRLRNLGFNVVVKSATSATSADATGKRVVIISDSVSATNVNTKFKNVSVGVVTLDPLLFDDMGMTATVSATDFGTTAAQKNVTITNSSHSMAAGLSGTVQVTSATTTFGWGKPNANAVKIATIVGKSTQATDFAYSSGAAMPGLTAPARRVGFFYTSSSSSLTTNGGKLFDNAVKWAAGLL